MHQNRKYNFWNILKKILYSALCFPVFVSLVSCQKNIFIPITTPRTLCVNEKLASKMHSDEFYVCGGNHYPCNHVTNRWSGMNKSIQSKKAVQSVKNIKEKGYEKNASKHKCLSK
jgi:hypothetical protein